MRRRPLREPSSPTLERAVRARTLDEMVTLDLSKLSHVSDLSYTFNDDNDDAVSIFNGDDDDADRVDDDAERVPDLNTLAQPPPSVDAEALAASACANRTFSTTRLASEDPAKIMRADFPQVCQSPPKEVPPLSGYQSNPSAYRPANLEGVFTPLGLAVIREWIQDVKMYEAAMRLNSATRRPPDIFLDDSVHLLPQARGTTWYFVDFLRGTGPIIPLAEAQLPAPQLSGERFTELAQGYHDHAMLDRVVKGHRDLSQMPPTTVLSANHAGAFRHVDAVSASFESESSPEKGWYLGPLPFLPCYPCRVIPSNAVEQPGKVRVTTDQSWPHDGSSMNDGIDLAAIGELKFCTVRQLARAAAILRQAEDEGRPVPTFSDTTDPLSDEFADSPHAFLFKIDLTAAYRQLHIHPTDLWKRVKSWDAQLYLDVRGQFGDASQVEGFQAITNFVIWLINRIVDGDKQLRDKCPFLKPYYNILDTRPSTPGLDRWLSERASLDPEQSRLHFLEGYLDDYMGAVFGRRRAFALMTMTSKLLQYLGFPLKAEKESPPSRAMVALGALVDLNSGRVALDRERAARYRTLVKHSSERKSMRLDEFRSLAGKLVNAAQYHVAGRVWLVSIFTALRASLRRSKRRVFLGPGVKRELDWWQRALKNSTGIALFPIESFPDDGSSDLLEYFFDASSSWGMGGATLLPNGDGTSTCFYFQHPWSAAQSSWHINVMETVAGFTSLSVFHPLAQTQFALEHGDNRTANASAERNSTPNELIAEVLRRRAVYVAENGVVCKQRYVPSQENELADPLSRGRSKKCMRKFMRAAARLGASRFVRIAVPSSIDDMLNAMVDGDTHVDLADEAPLARHHVVPPDDNAEFGVVSGFCGIDAASHAASELNGKPIAAFDNNGLVRQLWTEWHGIPCWGDFDHVLESARAGNLSWLLERHRHVFYVAGTPCPDWSSAGLGRGVDGNSGHLFIRNIELALLIGFPVIIKEQVPGILEVANGYYLELAISMLRKAGYVASWKILQANRHGDPTSRRRVFIVAVLPGYLKDNIGADDLLPHEGPADSSERAAGLVGILDAEPDPNFIYTGDYRRLQQRIPDPAYDGPQLWATVGNGGIGHHIYNANGPTVTLKTWGEGPGGETGLYWDGVRIRTLSPTECLKAHSFPEDFRDFLISKNLHPTQYFRLVGNSIPVLMLRSVMSHVRSLLR